MTTINEAREAIYDRFVTAWGSTTPLTFDSENFAAPDEPWARLTVRNSGSTQRTLGSPGNRRFRRVGSVFIQLFDLVDEGLANLDSLSRDARGVFEGVSFDGLDFTNVVIRESGADGKWFQFVVEAFFDYEETK